MSLIRIYERRTTEYRQLRYFATCVNDFCLEEKLPYYMDIKDMWYDLGADWMYTGLVTENLHDDRTWQSVNGRDYENILVSDSFSELEKWARDYVRNLKNGEISKNLTF